jgi:hypothetical protein
MGGRAHLGQPLQEVAAGTMESTPLRPFKAFTAISLAMPTIDSRTMVTGVSGSILSSEGVGEHGALFSSR